MVIYATDRLEKGDAAKLLGNSSGMILEETEGDITIGYVDFDVSDFGGRDYECFYKLDKRNSELFKSALQKAYSGDLFGMCVQAFSIKFSNGRFESFCAENGIVFVKNTY